MRKRRRRLALVALALGLAGGLGGAALAQTDADNLLGNGTNSGLDRDQVPVAKPTAKFQLIAGAEFGSQRVNEDSATPFGLDLYDVAFRNQLNGSAGGAECREEVPSDQVEGCERVPVIYQYTDREGEGPLWREVYRGEGRGFVGAIAWIDSERALAVGGDGAYPRREAAEDVASAGYRDPAGRGRAWLYRDGRWAELDLTGQLAQGMGGMTALDFHPAKEFGFAGALGQLWPWRDGRFTEKIDRNSPSEKLAPADAGRFRYRVREIRVFARAPGDTDDEAIAVTSGCCGASELDNAPAVLSYNGVTGQWRVGAVGLLDLGASRPVPESMYSVTRSPGELRGYVYAPGRPPRDAEPASSISGKNALIRPPGERPNVAVSISTARLVSGDGDAANTAGDPAEDGLPDWVVGEKRSTGQGLAVATHMPRKSEPLVKGNVLQGTAEPNVEKSLESAKSFAFFKLPSYALNSIDVIGKSGTGWAVGDRGAILALGEAKASGVSAEPEPPLLGSPEPARLASREPYDAYRPAPTGGEVGLVPPLDGQPLESVSPPGLIAYGSPNASGPGNESVREIVMSRDGSEGWAIGGPQALTLFHYDGSSWSRCDTEGVRDQMAPDPACAALAPLREAGVGLTVAARVPLERDDDPSNDDEFEVVAIGAVYTPKGETESRAAIARYRDGRWRLDDTKIPEPVVDLAFRAPNDGWLVASNVDDPLFYRFKQGRWIRCGAEPAACGNQSGRLPARGEREIAQPYSLRLTTAGDRVYLSGPRVGLKTGGNLAGPATTYPMIIWCCDERGEWTDRDGGYDPGFGKFVGLATPEEIARGLASQRDEARLQGTVDSLSVGRRPDGRYEGWTVGKFGGTGRVRAVVFGFGALLQAPEHTILRLEPGGAWQPWSAEDAAGDYLSPAAGTAPGPQLTLPGEGGELRSFMAIGGGPMIEFDREHRRWRALATPFPFAPAATVDALAPDGRGGFWAAVRASATYFYRYVAKAPRPVFADVEHPLRQRITALAGAPDGTVWAATDSDLLAHYDRLTGWETVRVPGWDPGRLVTQTSTVNALALGPDGSGLAVGEAGRIARIGAEDVRLDAAAGEVCDLDAVVSPCGTSRDLRAVAVAPDGSAIAAGERLALLWRPAGGEFRAIARPLAALSATITGVAMPTPERAWLALATGQVFAGRYSGGGQWSWRLENLNEKGDVLTFDANRKETALRAIAVDATGHGYAVGDRGLILERSGEGSRPWRRLATGMSDDLTAVALPAGPGGGALIGGKRGLMLTLTGGGRFEVARPADPYIAASGTVSGLALLPGVRPSQAEAWAALNGGLGPSAILHYASDPEEPLLNPAKRAQPLPDAPRPREGEIAMAAFGKSDCPLGDADECPEMSGSNLVNELVSRRVTEEILARAERPGGPAFVLFTGDVNDSGGRLRVQLDPSRGRVRPVKHRRWVELVAERFDEAGLPLFGAIGGRDLSQERECAPPEGDPCVSTKQYVKTGLNLLWRQAMKVRPAPWGDGRPAAAGSLLFKPAAEPFGSTSVPDAVVPDPDGEGLARGMKLPTGGARTHYAVDVKDASANGKKIARLLFVDTSLRSLAAGDPVQQPQEPAGGQQGWLQRVLCVEGSIEDAGDCTRKPGQQAIVVSSTPSYSYGPGAGTETQTDATAFEAILMRSRANLVVSGRLGWNGLYWATAPGVHEPCPGEGYQTAPPAAGARVCGRSSEELPAGPETPPAATGQLSDALRGLGAPAPPSAGGPGLEGKAFGILPFVVASGAGGKLGQADGAASKGFWRGYTVIRLDASGDPRRTIVEQRPVFDWIAITAEEHTLRPGQKITLRGFGRESLGAGDAARYDAIDTPAITHRYDLVEADPERPWLPRQDADGNYAPLSPAVATVDSQTGVIRAGKGKQARTFAIGILSVGEHVATYPLVFEPRKSFVSKPAQALALPPRPRLVPEAPAPVRVLSAAGQTPPPAPPPSQPPLPPISAPQLSLPAPPPELPPAATGAPPPVQLPQLNPVPPPPPAQPPLPLGLSIQTPTVTVLPIPTVFPPPAPPVQPAPPSGARREARQRQAATAHAEQRLEEGVSEERIRIDDAQDGPIPPGAAMTRRDRVRPGPSFTAIARGEQASAWARGALYGGGLTLMALSLALGWATIRPTPRRRSPTVPAPAHVAVWNRRWH